jgi:DNA-binding NtrC family response regulator
VGASNGASIAIVEDSVEVADILRLILQEEGFRVLVERHEDLARPGYLRRFIDERNPWVFLWDIPPPLREHWGLLERVRRAAPHQSFVVTSTNRGVLEQFATPGRFEILSKPFDLDEMLRALHRAVDARPSQQPRRFRAIA